MRRVTKADELSEKDRLSFKSGRKAHSLKVLWERVRPMVLALGCGISAHEIEGINVYIQQLTRIDPDSQRFRYATGIKETKAALEEAQEDGAASDLRTFADAMERLSNYLGGIDDWVGEIISYENEMGTYV